MILEGGRLIDPADLDDVLGFLGVASVVTLPRKADKNRVLAFMVESLATSGLLPMHLVRSVTSGLLRREQLASTGLGNGLAFPHLRRRELSEFVGLIGVAAEGVDFNSLDGCPARIVVMILSPIDQTERHLDILGHLSKLVSDRTLQYSVRLARSPASLLRFLGIQTKGLTDNE